MGERAMETVIVDLTGARVGLLGAVFRYEVMDRLARAADSHDVRVVAFGFGSEALRLVLEGDEEARTNVLRGLKVGTIRAVARWGLKLQAGPSLRRTLGGGELLDAVCWCHRAPIEAGADGPLASPWSSHRDLLGFRRARFYDAGWLRARVDPTETQRLCGGAPLPPGWPPPHGQEDLTRLLRVAAAVLGVLPADRRCFRLFVHLARARGWGTAAMAQALSLTDRRVRQLAAEPEPELPLALVALSPGPLSRVP
ncbi:MAG: hypothetical protein R3F59_24730 [Myxococcota bacterium]